jgi:hypothetical protein
MRGEFSQFWQVLLAGQQRLALWSLHLASQQYRF